jgi:branched-chain amino acid transport system permease protein
LTDLLAFSVFGVDWQFIKPFIVIGLAFGGVYALSGVGLVVLYRATGVLNLAFGAIGAAGALIAYWLINHTSCPQWLAFTVCVAFGGVVNLLYGMVFGPAFARRDPLVKMMGTLGARADPARDDGLAAPVGGAFARFLPLAELRAPLRHPGTSVSLTQIIALGSRSRSPSPSASSCA